MNGWVEGREDRGEGAGLIYYKELAPMVIFLKDLYS